LENADLILILCDHNEFKHLDYKLISEKMNQPIIFDTKDIIYKVPSNVTLYNYGNLYKLNK
ncbi:MAG: UDP-N-acetyl-D-mannosamine dehydrogenase, partial [Methanobrevibacter sp.]|nr:UDP-N-acetyl-D-mannosamine dehydrogenase [Methanobrevibacter sp.]